MSQISKRIPLTVCVCNPNGIGAPGKGISESFLVIPSHGRDRAPLAHRKWSRCRPGVVLHASLNSVTMRWSRRFSPTRPYGH
jgi:hypothetical protein